MPVTRKFGLTGYIKQILTLEEKPGRDSAEREGR